MQAIIMAGGAGSRLRPLTNDLPKPMVKIIDKPVLEIIIERLRDYGVTDIGVTVGSQSYAISVHFGDGAKTVVTLTSLYE